MMLIREMRTVEMQAFCSCFLLCIALDVCLSATPTPPTGKTWRIAVVGAGIGGSGYVHFLTEHEKKSGGGQTSIEVFEQADVPCGRVTTVKVGNDLYEEGGSILHPSNQYMRNYTEILGESTT